MNHQYPNGSSAECSRRRRAWQRWQTPNKRVHSGDIEGWQKKKKKESDSSESQVVRASVLESHGWSSEVDCNQCVRK